jgi:hypothetical protein
MKSFEAPHNHNPDDLERHSTMKYILASAFILLSLATAADAFAWSTSYVECSKVKQSTNVTFQACATTYFATPVLSTDENGKVIYVGGYRSEYRMTTGLKEGTDTTTVSETELKKAYKNGIAIQVALYDDNFCTVTVNVKSMSSECNSCKHCGNQKYTADCTNVANGRKVTCESALGSQTVGQSTVVKTPVASPVRKSPTKH